MYQDDEFGFDLEENYNNEDNNTNHDYDYDNSNNKKKSTNLIVIVLAVVLIILLISLFLSCDKKDSIVPSINIIQDKVYLKLNSSDYLPIELINADNTNINWQSDNDKIVTVDQSGNIFGVKFGSSNITATYMDANYKNYTDQCEAIVYQGDIDVSLDDIVGLNDIKLKVNNVYNVSLKFSPSNAYIYSVKYEIADDSIASINEDGLITGIKVGITKLNITVNESFTKQVNIEVYENDNGEENNSNSNTKPISVEFSKEQMDLMVNTEGKLVYSVVPNSAKNYKITFENNNDTVLHVENDGSIRGISVGTAKVTIKINDTITDSIMIKVKPFVVNVDQIVLQSSNNLSLDIGSTSQIRYNIVPLNASNKLVSFTSSNDNVASVDVNGVITANNSGTCAIVAKTDDGSKSVKINVTVN